MGKIYIYALIGGVVPALLWLFFWLHEDSKRPEPRGLVSRTFVLGMLSVLLVLPAQKLVNRTFPGYSLIAFTLWALLEECFKFAAAYLGGLHSVEDNEPLDPLVYMITAALGFVALENVLFILGPLVGQDIIGGIITGNLRFIGASLLHIVSSGTIGAALALTFYKSRATKVSVFMFSLVLAVAIHTAFNMLLIQENNGGTMLAFGAVWTGIALLLLTFEKVKTIAR